MCIARVLLVIWDFMSGLEEEAAQFHGERKKMKTGSTTHTNNGNLGPLLLSSYQSHSLTFYLLLFHTKVYTQCIGVLVRVHCNILVHNFQPFARQIQGYVSSLKGNLSHRFYVYISIIIIIWFWIDKIPFYKIDTTIFSIQMKHPYNYSTEVGLYVFDKDEIHAFIPTHVYSQKYTWSSW